jgi:hypothetical protein
MESKLPKRLLPYHWAIFDFEVYVFRQSEWRRNFLIQCQCSNLKYYEQMNDPFISMYIFETTATR